MISVVLGTLWYCYQRLRAFERVRYLNQPTPNLIDDLVDPWRLHSIRMGNDFPESTGYSYRNVGDESFVQEWIDYGLNQQFFTHEWLDEVDQILLLTRAEANEAILEFYE